MSNLKVLLTKGMVLLSMSGPLVAIAADPIVKPGEMTGNYICGDFVKNLGVTVDESRNLISVKWGDYERITGNYTRIDSFSDGGVDLILSNPAQEWWKLSFFKRDGELKVRLVGIHRGYCERLP